MRKKVIALLLAGVTALATMAPAFASHEGTPGAGHECRGIEVAEGQIGNTPYCD